MRNLARVYTKGGRKRRFKNKSPPPSEEGEVERNHSQKKRKKTSRNRRKFGERALKNDWPMASRGPGVSAVCWNPLRRQLGSHIFSAELRRLSSDI